MSETNSLAQVLTAEFGAALSEYELVVGEIDASEACLVGSGFALHFVGDREGLEVSYIERDGAGHMHAFTMRPLVMDRFTADDRAAYGNPQTGAERIAASVRVFASGLKNRCVDVLSGEKSWLRRAAWEIATPNAAVRAALVSL